MPYPSVAMITGAADGTTGARPWGCSTGCAAGAAGGRAEPRDDERRGTLDRGSQRVDLAHLEQFVATRRGVEGYVEPRTAVTETTIVLVAADGEWTRRRIDGPDVARRLSRDLAIPVYDAQVTGYPQRMRDWSARQKNETACDCDRSLVPESSGSRPTATDSPADRTLSIAAQSAMRASMVASRVRTGTPVPPLGV